MCVCHTARALASVVMLASAVSSTSVELHPSRDISILRWEEGRSGCTFSRDDDGKYRYGLWTNDFGIVLAVDSQELEKVRRRKHATFALHLTARYRGHDSLEVAPSKITLEFVKHSHDIQRSLDPDTLAAKEKSEGDTLASEAEREIRRHPEKKTEEEITIATRQNDIADMIAFLNTRTLRAARLDSSHPEINGWVLFNARSRWIGELQSQEEFVLRVPLAAQVIEFPFVLPPSTGDLILRHRSSN